MSGSSCKPEVAACRGPAETGCPGGTAHDKIKTEHNGMKLPSPDCRNQAASHVRAAELCKLEPTQPGYARRRHGYGMAVADYRGRMLTFWRKDVRTISGCFIEELNKVTSHGNCGGLASAALTSFGGCPSLGAPRPASTHTQCRSGGQGSPGFGCSTTRVNFSRCEPGFMRVEKRLPYSTPPCKYGQLLLADGSHADEFKRRSLSPCMSGPRRRTSEVQHHLEPGRGLGVL